MTTPRTYAGYTLDALLAFAHAATKGPWHCAENCEEAIDWWGKAADSPEAACCVVLSQEPSPGGKIHVCATNDDGIATQLESDDALFIAAAREAVPALIARIRELEKENNELGMRDVVLRSDYESVVLDRDDFARRCANAARIYPKLGISEILAEARTHFAAVRAELAQPLAAPGAAQEKELQS